MTKTDHVHSKHQSRVTVHRVERRPLGLPPLVLVAILTAVVFVVAVALLAAGQWISGIVVLGLACVATALFISAARREPETPLARRTLVVGERIRSRARLAGISLLAWSRAVVEVVRLRRRQLRLHSALQSRLEPLGDAAFRGDRERADSLKAEARALERALHETERDAVEALDAARGEVEREHATAQPTRSLERLDTEEVDRVG